MKKYRLKLRMKGTDLLFYPYGDRGAMYCAFGEHGADVALRRSALD